jgi:hypothetical protein
VLADVDGDGVADIVLEALFAFSGRGVPLAGFPKSTAGRANFGYASPAIGDFNGTGRLELAWVDASNNVSLWELAAPATSPRPWPMLGHDAAHGFASVKR